jgi:thiamine-phosphate pyrophosphorylase
MSRGQQPTRPSASTLRVVDANLNRAREGLRVVEDAARFVLGDEALTKRAKDLRHALASCIRRAGFDEDRLLSARDAGHDVGARVASPHHRTGWRGIIDAAAGRSCEALRSLEECCKLVGASEASAEIERARYAIYDLHRDVAHRLAAREPRQPTLCVLITEKLCTHHPWEAVAEAAVEAGADCIQLREKSLTDRELLRRARTIVSITRGGGAICFINDRPDVALASGADGVHVGQGDLPVRSVRALSRVADRPRLLVGVSTRNLDQARAAAEAGADICGVGPIFATGTKPGVEPVTPNYLRQYLSDPVALRVPHLAIGGVTPENVGTLARIGARGIAVSSAVCSVADPRGACEAILRAVRSDNARSVTPRSRNGTASHAKGLD